MLALFDLIITEAPVYESDDVVGFPINASLDWPMGTTGGYAAFVNPLVNEMFHKMLRVCAKFLESSSSRYVLTTADNGWFGPAASAAMPNFIRTFTCDPTAEYYGFNPGTTFSPDASEMVCVLLNALITTPSSIPPANLPYTRSQPTLKPLIDSGSKASYILSTICSTTIPTHPNLSAGPCIKPSSAF